MLYVAAVHIWVKFAELNRAKSGMIVPADKGQLFLVFIPCFIVCVLGVPVSVLGLCSLFGFPLALVEEWGSMAGPEYMVGNVLGLMYPITQVVPVKPLGIVP